MTLLNIIAFAILFRIIGGGIVHLPRWIPLIAAGVLLLYQVHEPVQIVAYAWLFFIIRLLATRPLLDASHGDKKALLSSFYRAAPIIIALPFTSWWYAVFLLQGVLYYAIGKIKYKYPITICELVSGAVFGGIIGSK